MLSVVCPTAVGGDHLAALLEAVMTCDGTVGRTKAARVKEREWEALELTALTDGMYVHLALWIIPIAPYCMRPGLSVLC